MISLSPLCSAPPSFKPLNPNPKPHKPSPSKTLKPSSSNRIHNRLIHHLDQAQLNKAISTLDLMSHRDSPADLLTYSLLLKSCIRFRYFELGKLLHKKLTNSGLELDSVILNSLIALYSKSGDPVTASLVFEEMGERKRDLVSWSSLISCYANNDMEFEAIVKFIDMIELGFCPNEYSFCAVIKACSVKENVWIGKIILGLVIKSGYFDSDVCVGCALIDMFVNGGCDLESAKKVFDKMPERNAVTWTLMITRYMQMGQASDAIELFLDMVIGGNVPDQFTFSGVISACAKLGMLSLGKQLHSQVIRSGLVSDVCVGCSLIDMYAKCMVDGTMVDSRRVFDGMSVHNVMSWTAIITGYVGTGGYDKEAIELFSEMICGQNIPNHFTFSAVLKACTNLSDLCLGEQVYTHAVKLGLASVNCVGNSLVSMYTRCGWMENARKAFDILFEKNLVSYNAIVDGYAKNLDSEEAFKLYHQIEVTGFEVDVFTFASLLSGAASISAIGKGEQIHAQILKAGTNTSQCIGNALISMYSRCGNIEAAFQVFNEMTDRNVISWTSMISGFAKHGFARRALEMFHKMLEVGIKPNEISYIAVLSACSHVGMVTEGWKHFNSMYQEHGIVPRMEHYACMVDVFGRSGNLEEAMEFISSMPIGADAFVWRTLLGACHVHGNKEIAKHAAKMIIEQDPDDPAAYILLSNLYSATGQWADVAEIRKIMKEKNMTKEPGCSWVEVENKIHKFYVGDTSHSLAKEIYKELDRLVIQIKKMGYIPNTNFVLHDVEEEQKEQYLFQHSEKIAVAFGLISTPRSKPIRVFKNLRVCGDCHNAMKFITMATDREIILRDSTRFHHIKSGACSCNDYW